MSMNSTRIPRPALVLGLSGLLPFFATALAVWLQAGIGSSSQSVPASDFALRALGAYGWGKLLDDEARLSQWIPLSLSVLPSLIGWCALLLAPSAMLLLLIAGFIAQYASDLSAARRLELPAWFGRLRLILSSGAVLSLTVALAGISQR